MRNIRLTVKIQLVMALIIVFGLMISPKIPAQWNLSLTSEYNLYYVYMLAIAVIAFFISGTYEEHYLMRYGTRRSAFKDQILETIIGSTIIYSTYVVIHNVVGVIFFDVSIVHITRLGPFFIKMLLLTYLFVSTCILFRHLLSSSMRNYASFFCYILFLFEMLLVNSFNKNNFLPFHIYVFFSWFNSLLVVGIPVIIILAILTLKLGYNRSKRSDFL